MNARTLKYKGRINRLTNAPVKAVGSEESGDVRDGSVYLVNPDLRFSVEVALAARRPLLLRGEPGSGKSSLAAYIARNLEARYYELVVTSRTQAQDLLWSFDAIRKLADAQARSKGDPPLNDFDYVEPGVLWWVLNRASALRRGAPNGVTIKAEANEPNMKINTKRRRDRAVVLIDEIDKADPDVPNGLLVPIGSSEFRVHETQMPVKSIPDSKDYVQQLLIVITTNETRELPDAFLRRCVTHHLEHPHEEMLVKIATIHAKRWKDHKAGSDRKLFRATARRLLALRKEAEKRGSRPPSTAEYLDAVRACLKLQVTVGDESWKRIERVSLLKEKESHKDEQQAM